MRPPGSPGRLAVGQPAPPRLLVCHALLRTQQPFDEAPIVWPAPAAGGDGLSSYAARRRNLACRPPVLAISNGAHESLPHHGAY
jgi:hypothetical protein